MEIGKEYNGFTLIRVKEIKDISSTLYEFKHNKTQGSLVYLENDDTNKCFMYGFRTIPHDSTGVCHIIEHSVLCGSKKYPLKEPFVNLLKSSMSTFLNAMTADDFTVYPVASVNDKDFDNLMDVYLDAVLNPLSMKDKKPFLQEGWHLHLEKKEDIPHYQGVVYNEMKGATSSVDEQLFAIANKYLYQGSSYQYNSGGDPENIIDLTYNDYKRFYKKHYHPSNGIIYLYGKMDILEKLKHIDQEYLANYEYKTPVAFKPVKKNINFEACEKYAIGPSEEEQDNTYFALSFGLDKYENNLDLTAINILNEVLMGSNDAPLKKAILDKNLGTDFYSYIFDSANTPSIHFALSKSNLDKKDEFYQVFEETLRKIVKNKVSKEDLLATININLFKNKEMDSGRMPKGLLFAFPVMQAFNYNLPLEHGLEYSEIYDKLKSLIDEGYFENLIKKYFLNSKHKTLITMAPSKTLGQEKEQLMEEKMKKIKASLSEKEINALVSQTKKLIKYQSKEDTLEELKTLPKLKISDLSNEVEFLDTIYKDFDGIKVLEHQVNTNGIAYLKMYFEAQTLNLEELPYLKILSRLYAELDTKNYKANDLQTIIKANLGSFDYALLIGGKEKNDLCFKLGFYASSLEENISYLSKVFNEVIYNTIYDHEKIKVILNQEKNSLRNQIIEAGNQVASIEVSSKMSKSGMATSLLSGYKMYQFVSQLLDNYDEASVEKHFQNITKKIFNKHNLVISLSSDDKIIKELEEEIKNFKLEQKEYKLLDVIKISKEKMDGIIIPSLVNYDALGVNLSDLGYENSGKLMVLNHILRYDYLWNQIRVKGGAYGARINLNPNADLIFSTYRDPNVKRSYKIFKDTFKYLNKLNITQDEFESYLIGAVGASSTPSSTNSLIRFVDSNILVGTTKEELERRKQEMIDTTFADIKALSKLFEKINLKNIFTVGNENKIKEETKIKNPVNL